MALERFHNSCAWHSPTAGRGFTVRHMCVSRPLGGEVFTVRHMRVSRTREVGVLLSDICVSRSLGVNIFTVRHMCVSHPLAVEVRLLCEVFAFYGLLPNHHILHCLVSFSCAD